ncbi:MAG TPA: primosomal protein N' [Candidatus Chromulinivoraceae bacterium]|nr:primosomal protein N' [Candidatus Chromulinivoraceae bacterium]
MHYYEVAPTQIIRANSAAFTYASETPLPIGQIVTIEVGKKILSGVITKKVQQPTYDTKQISSVIETSPLPEPLVKLAEWMSTYYATHLAIVLQTFLPRGLQKTRRSTVKAAHIALRDRTKNVFNKDQRAAYDTIINMTPGSALLHGITGSGKTAVYIELAKQTMQSGKSTIILVPEIALTSQVVDEFSHHFEDIILVHSRQTEAERHKAWLDALTSTTPRLVIGPRSALFTPLTHIGLIVIDEAHEPSFKQEQSPRYSALRAASILAGQHDARVVFGTATPSIADYYLFEHSGRPIIKMDTRARLDAVSPTITLIDMTKRTHFKKHRFLSDKLLSQIEQTLSEGNQALIFHNRRGSASTTLCENCGWSAICPRCFVPFTLHADKHRLECHICGLREKVPTSCPECGAADIIHKGIGTKLVESELKKLFPKKIIARFDGDNETGESVEERYKELYDGDIDIIIGTQVIAKGLDLPKLRTVGVIQADAGLSLPDYGSSERTFQLLAQVVGRVGRSHHPTSVIVQSYQPTHPAVTNGLAQNYADFYQTALSQRRQGGFPPYTYLLKLTCIYKTEAAAIKNAQKFAADLRLQLPKTVQILGPTPAFYERQHDTYRWQLTLKSSKRADLTSALQYLPPTHWQFELDPTSLL